MIPDIYKGFISSDGKIPKTKIKDPNNWLSLEDVLKLNCDFVGVLNDDVVMIDFDEPAEAEMILKIIESEHSNSHILKTSRGVHLYYHNTNEDMMTNKIHIKTPIGLTIDIKHGSKFTVDPLKIEGTFRTWLKISDTLDEWPYWLYGIQHGKNLSDSTTRNNDLYTYILNLQGEGFNKDQVRTIINIINKYILEKPLSPQELETIIRDDSFRKKSFFIKKSFQHHEFAKYLMSQHHIVKVDNFLYSYKNGEYSAGRLEMDMIKELPILTQSQRNEVYRYLEIIAPEKYQAAAKYISFKNGILDLETGVLNSHNPEFLIINQIDYNYKPDCYHELTDKTINKICYDDEILRTLLEEVTGYLLYRRNELGRFFILTGQGSNGKSTFLNMLKRMLGKHNYTSLSLQELSERFKPVQLVGKLANIGDDISSKYMDDNSILKKLVTGETINVERKGRDPFDFENYSKMLFACNEIPRMSDTTHGLFRRIVPVPFNAVFSKQDIDYDPYIGDKLLAPEAIEYLINIGIEGLKRVIHNKDFTTPDSVSNMRNDYEVANNPLLQFIDDFQDSIPNNSTKEVYLSYSTWCQESGYKPLNAVNFGRELCRRMKIKSKPAKLNGNVVRIYEVTDGNSGNTS